MMRRVTSTVHAPGDRCASGTARLRDCDNEFARRWGELGATIAKVGGPGERKDGGMRFATIHSLPMHSYVSGL
ncbi:hypothetical protein SAMN04487915_104138 [Arthrobacter sp. ov118]|nr:hypothetical protein SAMN04487915_104138 [Arthrobacter sp. ov118]